MSEPSGTLRCFVAIDLPPDLKMGLTNLLARLRDSSIGGPVRWVRPAGIHLTLKFLGDVPPSRRPEIERAVGAALSSPTILPFELTAGGLGVFPNFEGPRVIWVGLGGDLKALNHTQKAVETALAALGFPPENRSFSPHLTLGRIPDVGRETKLQIGQFIQNFQWEAELARFVVSEVVLMESELRPDGAIYTPLTSFKFGQKSG